MTAYHSQIQLSNKENIDWKRSKRLEQSHHRLILIYIIPHSPNGILFMELFYEKQAKRLKQNLLEKGEKRKKNFFFVHDFVLGTAKIILQNH